jgi:hypothetical protein
MIPAQVTLLQLSFFIASGLHNTEPSGKSKPELLNNACNRVLLYVFNCSTGGKKLYKQLAKCKIIPVFDLKHKHINPDT